jgi:hypothetical protein
VLKAIAWSVYGGWSVYAFACAANFLGIWPFTYINAG